MYRLTALLVLATIVYGYPSSINHKYNEHCHGLECPQYKVLNSTDDYEVRHYGSFKWATANSNESTLDYKTANRENFMKLFNYISGKKNVDKQKVEMTAPVLVHVPVTQGPFCAPDFTMHFFVPYKFQSKPPQPTADSGVKIMELPEMVVYVASFGGWMTQEAIQEHGADLGKALQKDGIAFDDSQFFTAGYDGPYTLLKRHNEIMFLPKENPFRV